MKLYYSATSPFVRKVMVLAIETGVEQQLELIDTHLTPVNPDAALNQHNPLGKVPVLQVDDTTTLFDSRVICEYLDTLHQGQRWLPDGEQRWDVLCRQALSDGILDAAVLCRYETVLRPQDKCWQDWLEGQRSKINRALDALEQWAASNPPGEDMGALACACALAYLDFRKPVADWREHRDSLNHWFTQFEQRSSMRQTQIPQ